MNIISAPFGNYLDYPGWISTIGTFTPKYRGGFWWRVWRCLRTLRWDRKRHGWVNRLGLPNPGIDWLVARTGLEEGKIVSVGLAHDDGWRNLFHLVSSMKKLNPLYFELNASCPNEKLGLSYRPFVELAAESIDANRLIVKLPPDLATAMEIVKHSVPLGVWRFHCCNTISTERGGLSGQSLIPLVSAIIRQIKHEYPRVCIIGGGGITGQAISDLYRDLGAEHIAVGSAWLNPLSHRRLRRIE